ncbi:MAG: type II secretion system F family protein [Solirubrobacterales bacterium]|nr:type II secretion system F family protein [Solirubrobacterales bacterium]
MANFAFSAVDVSGIPAKGELEAASKAQVTEQLRRRGLIVLDVSEKREALKLESLTQRFKSVKLRELSVFSRQFATLIASGMPMLRTLYTLEDQTEDEMLKKAIVSLRNDVESGSSVGQAMESQPGVFDPLYRSMVRAGEGAGRLEDSLERVAFQLEKLDSLKRQVKSAMAYPAVVFTVAMLVMIAVVAFIVPVFVGIFEEISSEQEGVDASLPLPTQITVTVSEAVTGRWYVLIPVFAVGLYGFLRWKRTERGRAAWDRFKLKLPAHIGDIVQKVALARWSRTLSGTISSGVPILQAIEISGQTAGNAVVEQAMSDVYDNVKRGGSIHAPLAANPVFPAMVSHMVSVGEESGQLEGMLGKVADFYDAEVDAKVKALTSLLEPVMIVIIGLIVGFIVISMYLPIFSLYENIR